MLHNARETMLEITVTGWETGRERVRVRGSRIILLSSSFNPLSIIKKSVCVPRIKLTLTENIRPFDSFQISPPPPLHCHLGCRPFTFRYSDEDIEIEALQRMVNALKKNPHTTPFLKLLHFNVSLQWMSLHDIFGGKTLLFWSDILPFSFLVFLK